MSRLLLQQLVAVVACCYTQQGKGVPVVPGGVRWDRRLRHVIGLGSLEEAVGVVWGKHCLAELSSHVEELTVGRGNVAGEL